MRQLLRLLGQLLRLDDPVAGLACDEAGMTEQRTMEADERLDPFDLVLAERPEHPPSRVFAVDAVDAELRYQRVVEAHDLAALADARVDPHAGPCRFPVARDPPRRRQEAGGRIFGVDPALDRVPSQPDVLLAQR